MLSGQVNLYDAVRRTISWDDPDTGKAYRLNDRTATLIVRPRGLHLVERHLLLDGSPVPGALVDAGLFLFHNAHELIARGTGPYLYLPKLESHREARLWNEALTYAESALQIPHGKIQHLTIVTPRGTYRIGRLEGLKTRFPSSKDELIELKPPGGSLKKRNHHG